MIVLAGPVTLTAPDHCPEEARGPIRDLRRQVRRGRGASEWALRAVESAAFGEAGAAELREAGKAARMVAFRQLLRAWGLLGTSEAVDTCR